MSNIILPFEKKSDDPIVSQFNDNCKRLMAQMNDGELEHAIRFLFVEDEYCENFEATTGKRAVNVHQAFEKDREEARNFAKLIIVTHILMVQGAKKLMRMSYRTMRLFMHEHGVKRTQASRWVFDKRVQYKI